MPKTFEMFDPFCRQNYPRWRKGATRSVVKFKIEFVPPNSRLRLMLLMLFPFAPAWAKVPVLPSGRCVLICEWICIRSAAPTGRGKGRANSRGSNLVTLSSPVFLPLFFPCPLSPMLSLQSGAGGCGNSLRVAVQRGALALLP